MPDETKPTTLTPKQEQEQKNATYKTFVGKTLTNGDVNAVVKEFYPVQLVKDKWTAAFLVNYGHPNMSFFVAADTFLTEFHPKQ